MDQLSKKEFRYYANFLRRLAADMTRFYSLKLNKPFKAINKKTGARGLRSILENILLKTMFELPDMEDVMKITVDKSSVSQDSEPIITYGKKQSTSVA